MGLWSKGIYRKEVGYDIENGLLKKCYKKEGVFTIPDDVTDVAQDAFEGCENVKINYSEKFIETQLRDRIYDALESLTLQNNHWTVPYTEFETLGPCMAVFEMQPMEIDTAIKASIEKIEEDDPDIKWKYIEIDADNVNDINAQIESIGRNKLVTVNGDSVSTYLDLPFLFHSPVRQLGHAIQYANDLISKEGFGVIFLKNLNEENYRNLPHNFIYNLVKIHSFCKVRLSPKWQVIIEVGEGVRLDAPGGVRFSFDGNWYRGIEIEKYLNEMKREGKLIEVSTEIESKEKEDGVMDDKEKNANEALSDVDNTSNLSPCSLKKEIDWEERHFQICLSLLSRQDLSSGNPDAVIKRADKMVEALKKHREELL